jgi:hypothetical protein
MEREHDERRKQLAVGMAILTTVTVVVVGLLTGWRHMPGVVGEWVGIVMGVMTTPFLLETSFFLLGLLIVIFLNNYRRHREGDEFVYLERVDGPDVPHDLPEHARWAIYRNAPLAAGDPPLLAQAEGALKIGDFAAAAQCIGDMGAAELEDPATLRVRLELARGTGHTALAEELARKLARV